MRRIFIILSIVSVLPFAANAQLSKLMSKYHEKNGVTVTQLDKSLYFSSSRAFPRTRSAFSKRSFFRLSDSCIPGRGVVVHNLIIAIE